MQTEDKMKTVQLWMKDVSQSLGTELKLDDQGLCAFQVGDDTVIVIEVHEDMIHLYSPLMEFPEDATEATTLMIRALELNAFQSLTRGGAIAVPPGGGPLILCFSSPIEGMDSAIFSTILGGFFETISEVRDLLNKTDAMEDIKENRSLPSLKFKA